VNWNLTQPFLFDCSADVLVLLDTCYAAIGGRDLANVAKGVNEVISACNEDMEAPGVNRLSFTRVLIHALKDFAEVHRAKNRHLSAALLAHHLINKCYPGPLRKLPHYARLCGHDFDSCHVIPTKQSPYGFAGQAVPLSEYEEDPVMILASIHLKSTPRGDIIQWLQGEGVPPQSITNLQILNIQVAHVYAANSAILIFKCPVAVWLLMPPRRACSFIGLVTSNDLLRSIEEKPDKLSSSAATSSPVISPKAYTSLQRDSQDIQKTLKRIVEIEAQIPTSNPTWGSESTFELKETPGSSPTVGERNTPDSAVQYAHQTVRNFLELKFEPLRSGETRLLKLLPGEAQDILHVSLEVYPESSLPSYDAISYSWGDPSGIWSIGTTKTTRPVSDNLIQALHALRLERDVRYLWVDTLCIDQGNKDELMAQVRRMAGIFRQATTLCIWLGPQTQHTQRALSFMERSADAMQILPPSADPNFAQDWAALTSLIRSSWFTRAWVVQEVCLSRNIQLYCGQDCISWDVFERAVDLWTHNLRQLTPLIPSSFNNQEGGIFWEMDEQYAVLLLRLRRRMLEFHRNPTTKLLEKARTSLIYLSACHVCTHDSDMVQSFWGLAMASYPLVSRAEREGYLHELQLELESPMGMRSVEVSYLFNRGADILLSENEATSTSFLKFAWLISLARLLIKNLRSLDMITHTSMPGDSHLPSWCPDWRAKSFRVSKENVRYRVGGDSLVTDLYSFRASGRSRPVHNESSVARYDERLFVGGVICDVINSRSKIADKGTIPSEWASFAGWRDFASAPPDVFWRTLVADRDSYGNEAPSIFGFACHGVFRDDLRFSSAYQDQIIKSPAGRIDTEYMRRVRSVVWNRSLFLTKSGRVGLGPSNVQVGDAIAILFGCSVPVVLRPTQREPKQAESHYRIVGQAYVHGIMNGEALPFEFENDNWVVESTIILV
jgi:Heterokaryon incompatibility protein (HET)